VSGVTGHMLAVRRRTSPYVDRYIEDRAAKKAHQFSLRRRRLLKMQAPQCSSSQTSTDCPVQT